MPSSDQNVYLRNCEVKKLCVCTMYLLQTPGNNLLFVDYFHQAKGDRIPATQSGSGKKQADKKQVDKKQADKKPAEKKPAEKKPADKKPADKKPVDKKPADKKPADKKDKPGKMNYLTQENMRTVRTKIYKVNVTFSLLLSNFVTANPSCEESSRVKLFVMPNKEVLIV